MLWIGFVFLLAYHATAMPQGKEVCGSNGLTYEDIEKLIAAQKETPDLEMMYVGQCKKHTATNTLRTQKAICGSDGKTYNNYKDLMLAKFKQRDLDMVYAEPCPPNFEVQMKPKVDLTLRSIRTTLDDTRVCGTDLRTYKSYGELEFAKLGIPLLKVLHLGPCDLQMGRSKKGRGRVGH